MTEATVSFAGNLTDDQACDRTTLGSRRALATPCNRSRGRPEVRRAVLRSADPRQAEATILARYQIVTASSWNATASRRFVGSSTASS